MSPRPAECGAGRHAAPSLVSTKIVQGEPSKVHRTYQCSACGATAHEAAEVSITWTEVPP